MLSGLLPRLIFLIRVDIPAAHLLYVPQLSNKIMDTSCSGEWQDLYLAIWLTCPMLLNITVSNRNTALRERLELF